MTTIKRRKEEFYCGECRKYFLTYLRTNENGNFTIQCPSCNHHHYRYIDNGLVTDKRCNEKAKLLDIIVGLESTLRDVPWHNDPEFRRSQMKAVGTP